MYFTLTVTEIFLIKATPYVRWLLSERGVWKKKVYKIYKIKLGVYYRLHSKERERLLEDLLCHILYGFQVAYDIIYFLYFSHLKALQMLLQNKHKNVIETVAV